MKIRTAIVKLIAWTLRVPLNRLTIIPIQKVKTLKDEPGRCHVWQLSPGATEDDRTTLATAITSAYIENTGREPQSLHIVVRNTDELRSLSQADARAWLRPWLETKNKTS